MMLGLQIIGAPTAATHDPLPASTPGGRWCLALGYGATLHVTAAELAAWIDRLTAAADVIAAAGTLADEVTA